MHVTPACSELFVEGAISCTNCNMMTLFDESLGQREYMNFRTSDVERIEGKENAKSFVCQRLPPLSCRFIDIAPYDETNGAIRTLIELCRAFGIYTSAAY